MNTPKPMFVREVARIDDPQFVSGQVAGHRARRLIDAPDAAFADPFVLMAEDWTPQGIFPFHPHRGIGSSANRSVRNGEIPMSIEKNIQTVKDFFAAIGRGDREALLALVAEDIEWIIPGEDWPLAGTRHGHAGLADLLETASKSIETSTEPREFVAQGDRVLVVGFASGKDQSHEQDVQGRLGLRHHRSRRQADEDPGVCRHAGTGAGRADGRVRAGVALAICGHRFGVDGG